MADIKFACPHCGQHITCDELWGGHQLDCPNCKNPLAVPAIAQPEAPAHASTGDSLVPKPPAVPQARLSTNPAHAAGPQAPQRNIPIRNLTAPPPKRKSPLVKFASTAAVLVVLGAGVYFGYDWYMRSKGDAAAAPQEVAKKDDASSKGPRQRAGAAAQDASAPADSASASTNAAEPLIPAVWTLDIAKARIPSGRANGALAGTNFVPETARIDPVGTAQVLRLLQGQLLSPDREVLIYLHLKAGEKLGGQTVNVSQDTIGAAAPQVTKRWKNNPKYAPQYKSFNSGYAMRLELGQAADGVVPGKIFLALPDTEQSVVAGTFKAAITTNVVETAVQAAPVMAPTSSDAAASRAAADAAMRSRYGR